MAERCSAGFSWHPLRSRQMIDERRRQELLLEHNDERLTDGGLDFAISACSDVEKSQDNYCTICCTIPGTLG